MTLFFLAISSCAPLFSEDDRYLMEAVIDRRLELIDVVILNKDLEDWKVPADKNDWLVSFSEKDRPQCVFRTRHGWHSFSGGGARKIEMEQIPKGSSRKATYKTKDLFYFDGVNYIAIESKIKSLANSDRLICRFVTAIDDSTPTPITLMVTIKASP